MPKMTEEIKAIINWPIIGRYSHSVLDYPNNVIENSLGSKICVRTYI